jgi:hypothetical protein
MSKPPKTYRLRVGTLDDGRKAFAIAGYCTFALGDYRTVDVWVYAPEALNHIRSVLECSHAPPGSEKCRQAFDLIVEGRELRIEYTLPADIARLLGWR